MIVIPMAGMSSRFFKAGYTLPKYMLEAQGETLFWHSVQSFNKYFISHPFLFIVKDIFNTPSFVEEQAKKLGIKNFYISILNEDTRGQAETVALGLKTLEEQGVNYSGSITIFNIDTFRKNYKFPNLRVKGNGYLEVFQGNGSNWSYVKPKNKHTTIVIETAEKKPISDLCCTGLYHFANKDDYLLAFARYLKKPIEEWDKGELYIAPLYNELIAVGLEIHYELINKQDVVFCGVPEEYEDFKSFKII
ncbi:capsular biosynthesis protein [Providencia sp. wls1922]|uniref:capsular biosynthesis protein n=1 Tax=Providencia sp. wls1922 TaxID=2675152 RepID=UPI0012B56577|nr:capsular biosynthesis protein [Providencia sp. wls1922]